MTEQKAEFADRPGCGSQSNYPAPPAPLSDPSQAETDGTTRDALRRLLDELPMEFSTPPDADPERGRQEFRVIKRRNVRAVHAALWDLQVALGVNYPPAGSGS